MLNKTLRQLKEKARRSEFAWRYVFNLRPGLLYLLNRDSLSNEAARVVADLNQHGVAITSVESLLNSPHDLHQLLATVSQTEREHQAALDEARASARDMSSDREKHFIYELLGTYPVLDKESVYAKFALQKPVLDIANAYFRMFTRLRYYNVWRTFATDHAASASQLWHRDREDFLILKMFVYLSDVDEQAGPFTYASGTHRPSAGHKEPEYFLENGVKRSADEQMARVIPPQRWVKGVGRRGTIIFADTRGYHKGGLARATDRLMYTCMFTSQASQSKEFLQRPAGMTRPADKEVAFALSMRAAKPTT